MIRSYRVWSAVMAGWYGLFVTSLIVHPPGSESRIIVDGATRPLPAHTTFFQVVFGSGVWTAIFGGCAAVLFGWALFGPWQQLWKAHLLLLVVTYAFGIGYVASAMLTGSAWTVGALALTTATAHVLIAQLRTALLTAGVLEPRSSWNPQ